MKVLRDIKAALGNGLKPDITHVRKATMVYIGRGSEYGNAKYERANYDRPTGSVKGDFERFRGYIRAAVGHLMDTLDAMERHQSQDPHLEDERGLKLAAYAPDTDATPGAKVGASYLPHVAHAAASLNMAIEQAVRYGLLPADPGQPWTREAVPEPIVDTPARVEMFARGPFAGHSPATCTNPDCKKWGCK
jgi:hypothetical protein